MEKAIPSKPQGCPPFPQSRMRFDSMWVLHNCLRVSSPWLIKINPTQQREGFLQLPPTLVKVATTPNTMSGSDIYPLGGPSGSLWRVFPFFFRQRFPIYIWENWDTKRLSVLPKIIWALSDRVRMQPAPQIPNLCSIHNTWTALQVQEDGWKISLEYCTYNPI